MKEGEITVINIKFAVSIFDKTFLPTKRNAHLYY